MIRSLFRNADGRVEKDIDPGTFHDRAQSENSLLWVDIFEEPLESAEAILRDAFQFHPLAVDDALRELHVPKLDDWGTYLYVGLNAILPEAEAAEDIVTADLDLFVAPGYIVSYQSEGLQAVERVWELVQHDPRLLEHGVERLLYLLSDEVVSGYFPAVDLIDSRLDLLEEQLLVRYAEFDTHGILRLKRSLVDLRRVVTPMREVMSRLARNGHGVLDPEASVFFGDVYDHLVRLYDIIESLRDLLTSSMDMYLSVTSNRLNEIMKVLMIVSTLFMPLTFVTGFFGMNFFAPTADLGGWTSVPALAAVLVAVVLVPSGMYLWMRRRAWA